MVGDTSLARGWSTVGDVGVICPILGDVTFPEKGPGFDEDSVVNGKFLHVGDVVFEPLGEACSLNVDFEVGDVKNEV